MDRRALSPDRLPAARGAYALVLRLERETALDIAALGRPVLPAGLYLYAGSAWGRGGIRARAARHLRLPKARVWHVDRLTEAAAVDRVLAFPGGDECALAARAVALGAGVPVPGFGASDCRRCPAHLFAVDPVLVAAFAKRDSPADAATGAMT